MIQGRRGETLTQERWRRFTQPNKASRTEQKTGQKPIMQPSSPFFTAMHSLLLFFFTSSAFSIAITTSEESAVTHHHPFPSIPHNLAGDDDDRQRPAFGMRRFTGKPDSP
ncbi:hypothetical protein ACLOJK_007678, partial [Asimina triloba]